jgi:hypothetical protein
MKSVRTAGVMDSVITKKSVCISGRVGYMERRFSQRAMHRRGIAWSD